MNTTSRTSKSLKNTSVALITNIISLILNFFSRKVFLDFLGVEILGLNTTAMNILQFLNLAELGIGGAISFTLYKPLLNNDYQSIKEIIALQGRIYKTIGLFVLIGGFVIMAFFPLIFNKITIPLYYAYTSFSAFLFSALLGYFVNYKQIILSADQKDYIIQYAYRCVTIVKVLVQMIAMLCFPDPYFWWLIMEFIFAIISAIILSNRIKKFYPYLNSKDIPSYNILKKKYSDILIKVKQIFFHKVAGFILLQSSPLIIYAIINLKEVTLYGNYLLIANGFSVLTGAIFNGMNGGIGNLIAEGNKKNILKVFFELYSVRTIFALILSFTLFTGSNWFIKFWIGSEYILPTSTVFLISLILFINISRTTIDSFLWGYGLYKDIWAPMIETTINLSLSIVLGMKFGLNGILSGVLISLILIIWGWKPIFLFNSGFKVSKWQFWKEFIKIIFVGCFTYFIIIFLENFWSFLSENNLLPVIIRISLFIIVCFGTLFFTKDSGIVSFNQRILHLLSSRFK